MILFVSKRRLFLKMRFYAFVVLAFALSVWACPPGPTGPEGVVGINWRGAFNASLAYALYDAVSYSSSSYICIFPTAVNGAFPPADTTHWGPIALQGQRGLQGLPGTPGAQGNTGPPGNPGSVANLSNPPDNTFAIGGAHARFSKIYGVSGYFNNTVYIEANTLAASGTSLSINNAALVIGLTSGAVTTLNSVVDDGHGNMLTGGALHVTSTTASTIPTNGAVIIGGGAGVAGAINVAGATSTFTAATASSTVGNGAVVITGGLGVGGTINAGFISTTGTVTAIGTITGGTISTVGTVSAGTVSASTISASGSVTSSGTISATGTISTSTGGFTAASGTITSAGLVVPNAFMASTVTTLSPVTCGQTIVVLGQANTQTITLPSTPTAGCTFTFVIYSAGAGFTTTIDTGIASNILSAIVNSGLAAQNVRRLILSSSVNAGQGDTYVFKYLTYSVLPQKAYFVTGVSTQPTSVSFT